MAELPNVSVLEKEIVLLVSTLYKMDSQSLVHKTVTLLYEVMHRYETDGVISALTAKAILDAYYEQCNEILVRNGG